MLSPALLQALENLCPLHCIRLVFKNIISRAHQLPLSPFASCIPTGDFRKNHLCPECGRRFAYRANFLLHQRVHSREKPFKCLWCEKYFYWKAGLIRHQMIHTKGRTFKCLECGKCFHWKSHFLRHQDVHAGAT